MVSYLLRSKNIYNRDVDITKHLIKGCTLWNTKEKSKVKIIDVHYDDTEPYYTISFMRNGLKIEKQTVAKNFSLRE